MVVEVAVVVTLTVKFSGFAYMTTNEIAGSLPSLGQCANPSTPRLAVFNGNQAFSVVKECTVSGKQQPHTFRVESGTEAANDKSGGEAGTQTTPNDVPHHQSNACAALPPRSQESLLKTPYQGSQRFGSTPAVCSML
jgi:hypothetical protein